MLTSNCFTKFCLRARTEAGDALRDFVIQLIRGVKALKKELDTGRLELKRVAVHEELRTVKRIKACESQKGLTAVLKANRIGSGAVYGKINGETNKAVTGLYKNELAKELGLCNSQVNARDYIIIINLTKITMFVFLFWLTLLFFWFFYLSFLSFNLSHFTGTKLIAYEIKHIIGCILFLPVIVYQCQF
jgi:hypothetical protein